VGEHSVVFGSTRPDEVERTITMTANANRTFKAVRAGRVMAEDSNARIQPTLALVGYFTKYKNQEFQMLLTLYIDGKIKEPKGKKE